jgi:uncharacterized protein YjiS (DUF1127 family)
MAFANTTKLADTGLTDRVAAAFRAAGERYAQHRLYKRTYNELAALTGRELADLGLSRSGIRRVALEAAYGTK